MQSKPNIAQLEAEVERLRSITGVVGLTSGLSPQAKAGRISGHARKLNAAEKRLREARRQERERMSDLSEFC